MAKLREKIIAQREKLKARQLKQIEKIKILNQKIVQAEKREANDKINIAGKFLLERMKQDPVFKEQMEKEITNSQLESKEKALLMEQGLV